MKPLPKEFYNRSTLQVAKDLLGCFLIHETREGVISGMIVETEAYLKDDPASHSCNGQTKRNEVMFGEPGRAYVYFTYGMHYCFNVVTQPKGIGEAVLIRALEHLQGIEIMKKSRHTSQIKNLCNGPAKLVQALHITKKHNNHNLTQGNLYIAARKSEPNIIETKRIGISKGQHLPHRFYIKDNAFVSKPIL